MKNDIDWQELIARLLASGMTAVDIGRRVRLSDSAICDLKLGRRLQPTGNSAVRLYLLDKRRTRSASTPSTHRR